MRLTPWVRLNLPLTMERPALEEDHAYSGKVCRAVENPGHLDAYIHLLDTIPEGRVSTPT
jgi:hypothetical protein